MLLAWFRRLGQLRRERASLQQGDITYPYARGSGLAVQRRAGNQVTLAAMNAGAEPLDLTLPWLGGTATDAMTGQPVLSPGRRGTSDATGVRWGAAGISEKSFGFFPTNGLQSADAKSAMLYTSLGMFHVKHPQGLLLYWFHVKSPPLPCFVINVSHETGDFSNFYQNLLKRAAGMVYNNVHDRKMEGRVGTWLKLLRS